MVGRIEFIKNSTIEIAENTEMSLFIQVDRRRVARPSRPGFKVRYLIEI